MESEFDAMESNQKVEATKCEQVHWMERDQRAQEYHSQWGGDESGFSTPWCVQYFTATTGEYYF
jgi:hypothetical protein